MTNNVVYAQGFMKKLLKKGGEKSETVLDTMAITLGKGVTFYPCSVMDSKMIVSGSVDFTGKTEEEIFINAMLYAIDKVERGREHIVQLDVARKLFSVVLEMPSSFYPDNSTYYKYANTFRVLGNELSFLASEIHVGYKNLMGDLKEMSFESLDVDKKAKHKNYVNELAVLNSVYLNALFQYVRTKQSEKVTHWDEISEGKIVKGMNETECLLAVGKPMHNRRNGNQIKWMVNNDFVVIFENGVVVKVIR